MKPKLGQKVYISNIGRQDPLCTDSPVAFEAAVGYLGEKSFIIDCYDIYKSEWHEYAYANEGINWFRSVESLKKVYPNAYRTEDIYVLEGEAK